MGGERITRLSTGGRRGLRVVTISCWLLGALIFLIFILSFEHWSETRPGPGEPGWFESSPPSMVWPILGIILFAVGGFLAKFAFAKPVSEVLATETVGAVQVTGAALGRGLKEGLGAVPVSTIKVKCRKCGFLESEDAKYCSRCRSKL